MRFVITLWLLVCSLSMAQADGSRVLPSWNDGPTRSALLAFVAAVTDPASADHVPVDERIAVFDNDGTLWVEQPMYAQAAFTVERVRAMASEHPEWQHEQPFQALLAGDREAFMASGTEGVLKMVLATHSGMANEDFRQLVRDWISTAQHPRFQRPYTGLVYQPMLELMQYLRANGFRTWIVSGGGAEFMRAWAEPVYGVPPEQVVGTRIEVTYEIVDGKPVLMRQPEIDFIDDKAGKPVGILTQIGRRPILAFGNSDGDYQMLEWTTAGSGKRLGLILHHDDATREYAYDRDSEVGTLDQGLDDAPTRGWVLVSMKNDWSRVFAPEAAALPATP